MLVPIKQQTQHAATPVSCKSIDIFNSKQDLREQQAQLRKKIMIK
jgi:hypothetical protein